MKSVTVIPFLLLMTQVMSWNPVRDQVKTIVANNDVQALSRLLGDVSTTLPSVDRAFQLAVRQNRTEMVALLLRDQRVDPTMNRGESIFIASKMGFAGIVRILLQDGRVFPGFHCKIEGKFRSFSGKKFWEGYQSPLIEAAKGGFADVIRLLPPSPKFLHSTILLEITRCSLHIRRLFKTGTPSTPPHAL